MKHTSKVVVALIVLIAAILGFSIFGQRTLAKDASRLEESINTIENSTRNKDWSQAEAGIERINHTWSNVKKTWSVLIDHQEIDNIDVTVSRLQMLIQAREIPSALSESAALRKYVGHIPDKETLNLENVF